MAIASAPIGRDHQPCPCGLGEALLAHRRPAAADGVDSKACHVPIGTNAHPADIVGEVIDAIGNRARQGGVDEVVNVDLFGLTLRSPLLAIIFIVSNEFFLLRVNRNASP